MRVNRVYILENNNREIENIKRICKKLTDISDDKVQIINDNDLMSIKHCDAVICGDMAIILLELTGRRVNNEDYQDKPDNTKEWLMRRYPDITNNRRIKYAIHSSEGFGTLTAKYIPRNIFRIDCREGKKLCEIL